MARKGTSHVQDMCGREKESPAKPDYTQTRRKTWRE